MILEFKFTRQRQLVETGVLTIEIESLNEEQISNKLKELDFKTFLIEDNELAVPDKWQFTPIAVRNNEHNSPPPPKIA